MTEPPPGPVGPWPDPGQALDANDERLGSLLADLADDPDAPPSTVTAESVLAAVHAQALAAGAAGPVAAVDVSVRTNGPGGSVVDGRKRFQNRPALLVGVLAAAYLAVVAALVIPLSLRSSETSTSESALNTAANSTALAGQPEEVPRQGAADQSAADQGTADQSAAGSALVQAPELASGQAAAAMPGEPPGPTDAGGNTASSAACAWAPLSADAVAALTQSLPPGWFGSGELIAACAAERVTGARLLDAAGGSLVVTVARAADGRCVTGSSTGAAAPVGAACVAQGSGVYLATDAAGSQTAYAYANGLEVALGQDRSGTGPPDSSPLTANQLLAAAQAVLGAQR